MIYIKYHRSVYPAYKLGNKLLLNTAGIQHEDHTNTPRIGSIQNSFDDLKPYIHFSIGFVTNGFLNEAVKDAYRNLKPHLIRSFAKVPLSSNREITGLAEGDSKFKILQVAFINLGGPEITFFFTNQDEANYIDIMLDKALEYINSPFIQKKIKKLDKIPYKEQFALKTLQLVYNNIRQQWVQFDLKNYVVNRKLIQPK